MSWDMTPMDSGPPECKICGTELEYAGRGRKPTKCSPKNGGNAECYAKQETAPVTRAGKNAALAAQTLASWNEYMVIGSMMAGLTETTVTISKANEVFEAKAAAALENDPELCKAILRAGAKTGKAALGIAYLSFAVAVLPTAGREIRDRRAAAETEDA